MPALPPGVKTGKKGFSLVELVVAMGIFAVVCMGFLNVSLSIVRTNIRNDIRKGAIETLEREINYLKSSELTVPTYRTFNSTLTVRSVPVTYTIVSQKVAISGSSGTSNLNTIRATVFWRYREGSADPSSLYMYTIESISE